MSAGTTPEARVGIFNTGVDRETSILELAEAMLRVYPETGSKLRFVQQEQIYGQYYEDIPRRYPDNTRMRTILKVEPKISLEEGLRRTIEWFRQETEAGRQHHPS
jgi:UDP-glucose 4-epimerase